MIDAVAYKSDEILEIFKEQHRLCSPLDFMADNNFVLTKDTLIWEWQDALDLLHWKKLAIWLNKEFRIQVSIKQWDTIFNPDDKRTLGDLCDFLSTVAKKEIVKPVKILGNDCLSAATFFALKRNLKDKGVNVSDLRPSTKIKDFLDVYENFSPLIEEVTLTGVRVFDKLEYEKLEKERRYKYWIDKILPSYICNEPSVNAGEIKTFRDLIQKIIENKKLGEMV